VIRLILLLIVMMLGYGAWRWFANTPSQVIAGHLRKMAWLVAIAVLAVFAATGRLNWLFALFGMLIATLSRLLPVILNFAPQLHRLWMLFQSNHKTNSHSEQSPPRRGNTAMSREEALAILGLKASATTDEIIQAHRKLMQRVHPDRGGSDYLAAQINQAKDVLMQK